MPGIGSRFRGSVAFSAFCLLETGCGQHAVAVEYRPGHSFSQAERQAIERVANAAVGDARRHLPALPARLRLTVQVGSSVIPETGETATTGQPAAVYWTVNPEHDGGVLAVVNRQLRATLFHELYHLVREARITADALVERAIGEGLATAFERDFGGAATPWGTYPEEISAWTTEFLTLPDDADQRQWMYQHPDGRRWIGFRVGTYLADRAVRASGLSLPQLATVPAQQIVRWATETDGRSEHP